VQEAELGNKAKKRDAEKLRERLPYRSGVGIVLLNRERKVWVGKRQPKWVRDGNGAFWQMPQGGIDRKEAPEQAAVRELYEETGVRRVELLARTSGWLSYDLPDDLLGVALKGRYRGQRQKWFLMRHLGDDGEINLAPPGCKPEFDAWQWVEFAELPDLIVPFKRGLYLDVITELAPKADAAADETIAAETEPPGRLAALAKYLRDLWIGRGNQSA